MASPNCPNCGAVISYDGGKHCDYCGAVFEEPRTVIMDWSGDVVATLASGGILSTSEARRLLERPPVLGTQVTR